MNIVGRSVNKPENQLVAAYPVLAHRHDPSRHEIAESPNGHEQREKREGCSPGAR
jgi:hypothetical protein